MRIAIYHNSPSGGSKRALLEQTRRLGVAHSVDAYTLSCAEHEFCDIRPFVRRHVVFPFQSLPLARQPFGRLNQGIRALDLLRLRAAQQEVALEIDSARYDAVLVNVCQYNQAPAVLQFLRSPSAYFCHEPPRFIYERAVERAYSEHSRAQRVGDVFDPLPAVYRRVYRALDHASASSATAILANSAFTRESIYRAYGISASLCYLGTDAETFRPTGDTRQDFFLSVGALTPLKGFDLLIRSLAHLPRLYRKRLVIVSNYVDPRERTYLSELAKELDVAVDIRVGVSDAELVRLYNEARITLYAPVMEPFGFVPLESMACGTPVIGVREAGVRESIADGETGLLVDRDPGALAGAIQRLLEDQGLSEALVGEGRRRVLDKWNWTCSVSELERHLARVAGLRASVAQSSPVIDVERGIKP